MKRVGALALILVLSACATSSLERLKPGSMTLDRMRSTEKPTAEWKNSDGSVTLEYSNRPPSAHNVMLDFDGKGVLVNTRIVNTEDSIGLLKTGMTRAEVQRIVGSPDRVLKDSQTGGDIWEIPTQFAVDDSPQRLIVIYWHPRVDGATRIVADQRF
ncbi:MAG: hypothetical protein REI09_02440 [Candidatus Dactylopiibacterium sp.]|nr:hypothetical protein [Candidatus Dactylopiibacterium sp.]